ncbi:hypothetical protein RDI58_014818 [Solanum bulbocastanum]|uniref:DUF4218 domain-containing protein n=1 Tax=Solanum bulbocastanum TaxID=147425 RepID=A0AAN8TKD4_SOLBU
MEENILVITTKLEKIFPCGFFDVMEHLPIHLVQEAHLGGLVQTRWMYPFESSKQTIKQQEKIEGSVVQGHIGRETGDFYSYYFGDDVSCSRNKPNRNDEGDIDHLFPPISIFNQYDRGSKTCGKRGFTNMKMQSAMTHILLNCPEIQPYIKNKKTNNSGVCIQGDVDGTGQTIEYYGVIHEIIEVRYSSWPNKKIVLFRCEWFDPSDKGTKVDHQHNIIEVKHTRKYRSYDPFIIA